jgi:hypothetical protein
MIKRNTHRATRLNSEAVEIIRTESQPSGSGSEEFRKIEKYWKDPSLQGWVSV